MSTIQVNSQVEERFIRRLAKIKDQYQATKLWNWIDQIAGDSDPSPELLWALMTHYLPWAFDDERDANSIRFVYDRSSRYNTTPSQIDPRHCFVEGEKCCTTNGVTGTVKWCGPSSEILVQWDDNSSECAYTHIEVKEMGIVTLKWANVNWF
jgi:hypothetical protein